MNNSAPLVSLIIPTCNRAALLIDCLKSVANLDYPSQKLQVIVVDDGSEDNTQESIHALDNLRERITYIRNERNQGVSVARNTGMECAAGAFWVFLDDDCSVPREWLSTMIETFYAHPSATAVGGGIMYTASSALGQAAYLVEFSSWLPAGNVRTINNIPACNIGYRADDIRGHRFDEGLQPFEDSLFNYRLVKAGKKIIFNPRVSIFHRKGELFTLRQFIESQERYAGAFLQGGYRVFGWKGEVLRKLPWLNLFCCRLPLIGFRCLRRGFMRMFFSRLRLIIAAEFIRGRTICQLAHQGNELAVKN